MNIIYLSIRLCHFQFLSSLSYNFPSTGLSPSYLDLFLDILFFFMKLNGIVFLTFLSSSLLLGLRNATDFCILILDPETLLNSLMNSSSFMVVSLGWSVYGIMSFANSDNFTSSFPILYFFYFSFLLIAVARRPNITINKCGENVHSCLILDLRGNAFSFLPLTMMLAMGLSYIAFIMLMCFL